MLLAVSGISINIKAMSHRTLFVFFLLQQLFANKDSQNFTKIHEKKRPVQSSKNCPILSCS